MREKRYGISTVHFYEVADARAADDGYDADGAAGVGAASGNADAPEVDAR